MFSPKHWNCPTGLLFGISSLSSSSLLVEIGTVLVHFDLGFDYASTFDFGVDLSFTLKAYLYFYFEMEFDFPFEKGSGSVAITL